MKDILRQTELQRKILQSERELVSTDRNSKKYDGLQKELFLKKHELDLLRQEIKNDNPLYYQSFLDTNFITVKDVKQKVLRDHQVLVELFAGDSATYVLVITLQRFYLKKIDKGSFERLSNDYRNFISHPDLLNTNFENFKNLSWQLYQLIFHQMGLLNSLIQFIFLFSII